MKIILITLFFITVGIAQQDLADTSVSIIENRDDVTVINDFKRMLEEQAYIIRCPNCCSTELYDNGTEYWLISYNNYSGMSYYSEMVHVNICGECGTIYIPLEKK